MKPTRRFRPGLRLAGHPSPPRRHHWAGPLAALLVAATLPALAPAPARADPGSPCGATVNPIVCENRQPGTPENVWNDTTGAGDASIQGFTTDVSTNVGGRIDFKISTPASSYRVEIYRLGWYQGYGARLITTVAPSATLPQTQPTCTSDPSTQLLDCGNWAVSASWNVPSTAVSGIYVADLRRTDGNTDNSQVPFVVRNDASHSDVQFQTSDATWQAYNSYGGSDLYTGNQQLTNSQARAFKLSYNRPYSTRGDNDGRDYLFSNEYPTLRFLERNGYDLSYSTDVDTDRFGSLISNHRVFLSVGHDEYWSQRQRDNVVAARDQGVNLMFLSGNEMYWRTRYEPSIDGLATAYRTITCYKETWDNSPTDPVDGSTSTFRDPRFKTGALGGNPENAVTGTLFMANQDDLPLSVSGAEGKLRLWRNTALGSVADTTVTKLAAHTVGYESDEDLDNGSRPAGLVDLSTTVGNTPMELQDFGLQTAAGTTTHHVTLYRAASGALVFGAGTIQWGWGLDADHDGFAKLAADTRMQQATINMLADMRALATNVQNGLVAATTSADTVAPTVTVSSPAGGSSIGNGTVLTVSGTATDGGGGAVAGVEVSLDGGSTWHPAVGRASWTYTGVLHGAGSTAVLVRATDDSANTSSPTSLAVTVTCPCTVFGGSAPAKADGGDATAVTLGTRFTSDTDAFVTGIRFYKASTNTGSHIGTLWSAGGTVLARGSFAGESASGWQTMTFSSPVSVTAGTTYVAGYYAPRGHYSATTNTFLYRDHNATPLHAAPYSPAVDQVAGVYSAGNAFPISSYQASNYWVDPVLSVDNPLPPTVTAVTPRSGATGATGRTVSASFGGPVAPVSVAFTVTQAGTTVTGTTSYDAASDSATYTLPADFPAGATVTASVTASGTNGVAMSSPFTWSFRAAGATDGSCPCSLYPDTAVPTTTEDPDTGSVELGVAFTADTDGVVTGVEFYKSAGNIGTHTATLWSASGTALATTTFTQETPSGWQYAAFSSPVPVTAGTSYTASYHAPNGHYSSTAGDYTSGRDAFPLHVPAGGARYTYGTGAPTSTSTASYAVDVDFAVPASTVPSVSGSSPAAGATGVATGVPVTATYDNSVTTGSPVVTVTAPGGSTVPGTTTLDDVHRTVTFSPSAPWTSGSTYQVSVSGGRSLGGTVQSSAKIWSFTVGSASAPPAGTGLFAANTVPATIDSGDAGAVSLGVRFSSSAAGSVTGVRFYKASSNTGVHKVSLWSASGTRLATATVSGESTSGWQYAAFASAVSITAGTVYVVSYYAPKGHYSVTGNGFGQPVTNGALTAPSGSNGVYVYGADAFPSSSYGASNYWVDPYVVTSASPTATVVSQSPAAGSSSVAATATPSTAYSADLAASTVQATVTQQVGSAAATTVAGTVAYATGTRTVTFTPTSAFTAGATVAVSVTAKLADGATAAPTSAWTYIVARPAPAPGACPCTLWSDSAVPTTVTDSDQVGVELGTAFSADVSGSITGVSFYKGPSNTGTHTVFLYDANANRLATATVTNETTSGWQTATFASPVVISAGATYVVSYFAPVGAYSSSAGHWTNGLDVSPLHVAAGASGRYVYRSASGTNPPTTTSTADYAVEPVFVRSTT